MGQVLIPDKIADLAITGVETLELAPSIMTIGGQQFRNTSALSLDVTVSGAGGIDTGSVAADTTYFVYTIRDSGVLYIIASLNTDVDGPDGYDGWKLVGAFDTDANAEIGYLYETDKSEGIPKKDVEGEQSREANIVYPSATVVNKIINGNMDFWQRGTSFTSTSLYDWTADRWQALEGGTSDVDMEQSTDVPTIAQSGIASKYSLKLTNQSNYSPGASEYRFFVYRMEGHDSAPLLNKRITLSFWVKSSVTGVYGVSALVSDSTPKRWAAEYTIDVANTWERKTITIDMPATTWSAPTIDHEQGIGLMFGLMATDTRTTSDLNQWSTQMSPGWRITSNQINWCATSGNTFYISQVMLHEGSVAAPTFQRAGRNIADELAMCQRYYEKSYDLDVDPETDTVDGLYSVFYHTDNRVMAHPNFKVTKRTAGTIRIFHKNGTENTISAYNGTGTSVNVSNGLLVSESGVRGTTFLTRTGGVALVAGVKYVFHWTVDAEL